MREDGRLQMSRPGEEACERQEVGATLLYHQQQWRTRRWLHCALHRASIPLKTTFRVRHTPRHHDLDVSPQTFAPSAPANSGSDDARKATPTSLFVSASTDISGVSRERFWTIRTGISVSIRSNGRRVISALLFSDHPPALRQAGINR